MRKLNLLLILFIITGAFFVTSCGSSSNDDPAVPTINFKTGDGYTSANATLAPGTEFTVGVTARGNEGAVLTKVTVSVEQEGVNPQTIHDSTINVANYDLDYIITAPISAATVKYIFTAVDNKQQKSQISLTITTTASIGGAIVEYSDIILGGQKNVDLGSSFASSNGKIYKLAEAKANSALIDWIYAYDASKEAMLGAPADAEIQAIYGDGISAPMNWDTKNNTKFKVVDMPAGTTWASITNDAVIVELAKNAEDSKVSYLGAGKYIVFKTVDNKSGIILIKDIAVGGPKPGTYPAGTITYSVKVQK